MVAMEVCTSNAESDSKHVDEDPTDAFDEQKLKEILSQGILDFDDWTTLISEIESSFPNDLEKLCLVYNSFLAEFPLCHGYWRKYAYHKMRLSTVENVVKVFEQAVQAATYCVAVWVDYCAFGISAFEDPKDVRRLFERGISVVGKDYLCHALWDKYIEFELAQQHWSSLAHIYLQALRFPSKKLDRYYQSFRILITSLEEEMDCKIDATGNASSKSVEESMVPARYTEDEISQVIRDLLGPSIGFTASKSLQKYFSIGEQFYWDACQLVERTHCFETHIRRPYFHILPLDTSELENWHRYLNFIEKHGDFDWAVKLYERCLIPCANYPEFWMRYVDFVDSKGGREIANYALARATQISLKNASVIHLFSSRYREHIGDISAARDAFSQCRIGPDSSFVEKVMTRANMEKRLGNFDAAINMYKEAIENVAGAKEDFQNLPMLYVQFSRFKYTMTNDADAAREILMDGIKKAPHCKLLLEELIKFTMMHGGSQLIDSIDSIIAKEIYLDTDSSNDLSANHMEDISSLYIQFVDLCGSIHDVRKAWNRHIKLFPHSVRFNSYQHPATSGKPLKDFLQKRPKTLEHNIASTTDINGTRSSDAAANQVSDQVSQLAENCHVGSDYTSTDPVHPNQIEDNTTDPDAVSLALGHQAPKESHYVCRESEEDLKQLSLEKLSLDPQNSEALREIGTSNQSKPKDGPVKKRAHFLTNPSGAREIDAIEIQPNGTHSPSSSSGHQNILPPVEVITDQEITRHGSRISHQRHNPDQSHRDPNLGSRKKLLHRQVSQRQNFPSAETCQGVIGQSLGSVQQDALAQQSQNTILTPYSDQASPPAWSIQNLQQQQQNLSSASQTHLPFQPTVAYPQVQMPQNHVQSNDKDPNLQNNEAYNQMWQYYYYYYWQQQQFLSQQTQPDQIPQQQILPEQWQQNLLQLHHYFQQQSQQIESQQLPQSQQPKEQTEQNPKLQQSQAQQNQQQQPHYNQLELQQQQLSQHLYPQQQLSYEQLQQQQYLLYLQYQQQQQQWPFQSQLQEQDKRNEEQKSSLMQVQTQGEDNKEEEKIFVPFQSPGTAD